MENGNRRVQKITSRKIYYVQSWNILRYHSLVCFLFSLPFAAVAAAATATASAFGFFDTLDGRISCNTFFEMHSNDFAHVRRNEASGMYSCTWGTEYTDIISFVSPSPISQSPPLYFASHSLAYSLLRIRAESLSSSSHFSLDLTPSPIPTLISWPSHAVSHHSFIVNVPVDGLNACRRW